MKHEKNHISKDKDNTYFWTFCQIKYEKINEGRNKKVIIPCFSIALQVGNKFYLNDLKTITRSKSKNIKIIKRFDYVPAGASAELIYYFKEHLRKIQAKLNSNSL